MTAIDQGALAPPPPAEVPRARWRAVAGHMRRDPVALCAFAFLVIVVLVAVFAPLLTPYLPDAQDIVNRYAGYSWEHPLGTDSFGRDVLARLMYGARTSLVAAVLGIVVATGIGIPLGLVAGYFGGRVDSILSRVTDALMSIPALIFAMTIVAVLGNNLTNAMVAVGVVVSPRFFRLVRAGTQEVRAECYIEAASAIGCSTSRILGRHVLPNILSPVIVQVSLTFGFVILSEATLAYLGIGVQAPTSSWGSMLLTASSEIYVARWSIIPPGLAITLTVLAFTLAGDAIRDALGTNGSRRERV